MRIGEIAELIGVSARAVRHYHQVGLLPEPERQANGYRVYGLRDAVRLARVRRLTALGLSLGEVRDVLAGEAGRDLAGALAELDADLARQEAEIRDRRARLAVLLRQAAEGELSGDAPLSPELTELLREQEWAPAASEPGSKMAARDRELFVLLDTTAPELVRGRLLELVQAVGSGPEGADRARSAYALLDGLADASPDDPAVRR
ncbi:MerR family transcriptional regulator, partial [Streptomyces sparsus]